MFNSTVYNNNIWSASATMAVNDVEDVDMVYVGPMQEDVNQAEVDLICCLLRGLEIGQWANGVIAMAMEVEEMDEGAVAMAMMLCWSMWRWKGRTRKRLVADWKEWRMMWRARRKWRMMER